MFEKKVKAEEGVDPSELCKDDTSEPANSAEAQAENSGDEAQPTAEEPSMEDKLAEQQDKYLRLVAEFDNYRKRTTRERADLLMSAGEGIIKSLLPVLDDFERALKAAETADDVAALQEGTKLIYQKLYGCLDSKGLKAIETPVGADFDTDLHDAVTRFPAPDEAHKNKIIDTVEKGYKLYDKVIRYAKVVVGE
jgi:molecular chaperone GrpE